ncbi:MAG: mannosyltransferase [Solirubrobacteraceae bacterium]|nr:mannosyltransferase [Solirubrobacteraceae bacterium]
MWPLVLIVGLGAALRFAGIGDQSFWFDESVTAEVVRPGVHGAWDALKASESTPPLYYGLAWLWTRVFGHGEAGLRSLSAVFGTLTIPVAWAAAREVTGRWGAWAAALVVAVSPLLVWYSQEARAYSLLVLMGGVSLWLCLRAVSAPSSGRLVVWALAACLVMFTHYFGAFVVAGEALVLLPAFRRRPEALVWAVPLLAATGVGLRALSHAQGSGNRTSWIATIPLGDRVSDVARELGSASTDIIAVNAGRPTGPATVLGWVGVLGALAVGVAVWALAWRRGDRTAVEGSRRAGPVAVIAAAGLLIPLALALAGDAHDYFLDRNLLAAAVPVAVLFGVVVGLEPTHAVVARAGLRIAAVFERTGDARKGSLRPVALALVGLACLAGVWVDRQVLRRPELGRADWRAIASDLGPDSRDRVIAIVPGFAQAPLRVYGRELSPLPPTGVRVTEVDLVGNFVLGVQREPRPPAGFAAAGRATHVQVALLRYHSPSPRLVTPAALVAAGFPADGLVVEYATATRRWTGAYLRQVAAWTRILSRQPTAADLVALQDPSLPALTPVPPGAPYGADLHRLAARAATAGAAWARQPGDSRLRARFAAAVARAAKPRPGDLRRP